MNEWCLREAWRRGVFKSLRSTWLRKPQEEMCLNSEYGGALTALRSRSMLAFAWGRVRWETKQWAMTSSVKEWTKLDVLNRRLLITEGKGMGVSKEPCGTLTSTRNEWDRAPPTWTEMVRLLEKPNAHVLIARWSLKMSSFYSGPSFLTRLVSLDVSRKNQVFSMVADYVRLEVRDKSQQIIDAVTFS